MTARSGLKGCAICGLMVAIWGLVMVVAGHYDPGGLVPTTGVLFLALGLLVAGVAWLLRSN